MTTQQNKWILLLSSICFGLFGYFAIINPVLAIIELVFYLGIVELAIGCFGLIYYLKNKPEKGAYVVISSILSIIFGLSIMFGKFFDVFLVATLPYFIGVWAICSGGVEIYNSKKQASENKKTWVFVVCGLLGIIYGIFMLANPYIMLLETEMVIGFYFIFFAVVQFVYFIMSFFKKDE